MGMGVSEREPHPTLRSHGNRMFAGIGSGVAGAGTVALGVVVLLSPPAELGLAMLGLLVVVVGLLGCAVALGPETGAAVRSTMLCWASLLSTAPLLEALEVDPQWRVLGPAIGAGAVVPLVLAGRAAGRRTVQWRTGRWLDRTLIVMGVATSMVLIIARDPFEELTCPWFCGRSPFVLSASTGVVAVAELGLAVAAAAWLVAPTAMTAATRRGGAAQPTLKTVRTAMIGRTTMVGTAAICAAMGCLAVAYAARGADLATGSRLAVLIGLQLSCVGIALSAMLTEQLTLLGVRARLRRQTAELAAQARHGSIEDWLRQTTEDPTLHVSFVGLDDDALAVVPVDGRSRTVVEWGNESVATVEYRESTGPRAELALNPLARAALQNDRLEALARQQYETLVSSRRETVRRGDDALRQLQRNLHDGAQQRLLFLGMVLAQVAQHGDAIDRQTCARGVRLTTHALAALRGIANDAIPATLDQIGLEEGLRTLSETSDLLVSVRTGRWDPATHPAEAERTAYHVARATSRRAARDGATCCGVGLQRAEGVLSMSLTYDGPERPMDLLSADRIGAVRGTWTAEPSADGSWRLRIELPCE